MRDHTDKIEYTRIAGRRLYPWRLMTRVGDMFFVEDGNERALSAVATKCGREDGRKFVVKTVRGGVRVVLIDAE